MKGLRTATLPCASGARRQPREAGESRGADHRGSQDGDDRDDGRSGNCGDNDKEDAGFRRARLFLMSGDDFDEALTIAFRIAVLGRESLRSARAPARAASGAEADALHCRAPLRRQTCHATTREGSGRRPLAVAARRSGANEMASRIVPAVKRKRSPQA